MTYRQFTPITSLIWYNFFVAKIQNVFIGSFPNKRFSGYQLLAYYFVSWKLGIPEHAGELGLDYNQEYDLAIKMTKI